MEKTKLIAIKDLQSAGKSTTMWLLLKALIEDGAKVQENRLYDLNHDCDIDVPDEMPPHGDWEGIDFYVVLEWHDLIIVLDGRGDYPDYLVKDIKDALKLNPDYIICAIQMRPINRDIWNAFNNAFPNTQYERVFFGAEFAKDPKNALMVKQPTIEAIMKYMA